MRTWAIPLATLVLTGCVKGPYNLQVEAEIRDGPVALQLLKYEKDTYFPHPHVGGHSTSYAIVVRDDKNGRLTWLSNPAQRSPDELKKRTFRRSSVSGGQVVYFPIAEDYTLTPAVRRRDIVARGRVEERRPFAYDNAFVFRRHYGDSFDVVIADPEGAPFVVDKNGILLSQYYAWVAKQIDVEESRIMATQFGFMIAPMWTQASVMDLYDIKQAYRNLDDDRSGCPECEPIFKRTIVSDDDGMSWHLASYEVLRPLPEGSIVRGDDYFYDEKLKKVAPKSAAIDPGASVPSNTPTKAR